MTRRPTPSRGRSWSQALQARAFYAGGAVLRFLHLYSVSFDEAGLMETARRHTGLSSFGDESFLPGLREMTRSLRAEARLGFRSEVAERFWLIEILKRRLFVQADVEREPGIRKEPITRPLFVLGMPRSGTTLLQHLLQADGGVRWLHPWEIDEPQPKVEEGARDPREERFIRRIEQSRGELSELDKIHALDSPADCDLLFLPTFYANLQTVSLHVPSYDSWLEDRSEEDWQGPYGFYRLQLQRLQRYRPTGSHWVLKSPLHLGHLPALLATFPDARLVHLHRDPKKAVASTCSMVTAHRLQKTRKVDRGEVGRFIAGRLERRVAAAMRAREEVPAAQIVDVLYPDLLSDPLGTVEHIYDHFGMKVGPAMVQGMEEHLRKNPQHKRGVHRYSLEQFGLSGGELDRRFEAYRSAFGVATEGNGRT